MNFLYRYLMIFVACTSLLIGIQIPNLADQYEKRIDAHLREVANNLQPFQKIANQYFNGSLEKLLEMHRNSDNKVFLEEGFAIENLLMRKLRFKAELSALRASLAMKVVHILFYGDRELIDETLAQYSYAVPLNQQAIIAGLAVATIMLLLLELLLALARMAFNITFPSFRQSKLHQ